MYPRSSRPIPNMPNAQMLPMNAEPNAAIGILHHEPMAPTSMPTPSSAACLPPLSPASVACAAATPGGHAPEDGKILVLNSRYSKKPSRKMAQEKGNLNRQQQVVGSAESC